jgi:hypothetical protein
MAFCMFYLGSHLHLYFGSSRKIHIFSILNVLEILVRFVMYEARGIEPIGRIGITMAYGRYANDNVGQGR